MSVLHDVSQGQRKAFSTIYKNLDVDSLVFQIVHVLRHVRLHWKPDSAAQQVPLPPSIFA